MRYWLRSSSAIDANAACVSVRVWLENKRPPVWSDKPARYASAFPYIASRFALVDSAVGFSSFIEIVGIPDVSIWILGEPGLPVPFGEGPVGIGMRPSAP